VQDTVNDPNAAEGFQPHDPRGTDEAGLGEDCIETLRVVKPGQAEVLASALADAIAYRTPEGFCRDCEDSPSALCGEHAADLDLTDAYLALARELNLEVDR
jgi:hypothetical protein